jgi:hypothetical protein
MWALSNQLKTKLRSSKDQGILPPGYRWTQEHNTNFWQTFYLLASLAYFTLASPIRV